MLALTIRQLLVPVAEQNTATPCFYCFVWTDVSRLEALTAQLFYGRDYARPCPAGSGRIRTDRVHGAHNAVGSRRREHGTRGTTRGVQLGEVGRRPGNGILRVVQSRRDMCKRIEYFSRVLQRPGLRFVRRPRVASHRRHRNVAGRE